MFVSFGQVDIDYNIKAKFDEKNGQIDIDQIIYFKNTTENIIDTIYMNDWSNSFSNSKTPLAKRFGEEYDRSFYLSSKNKLGYTLIEYIKKDNIYFATNLEYWFGGGTNIDYPEIRIFDLYEPKPWRDSDLRITPDIEYAEQRCKFYKKQ